MLQVGDRGGRPDTFAKRGRSEMGKSCVGVDGGGPGSGFGMWEEEAFVGAKDRFWRGVVTTCGVSTGSPWVWTVRLRLFV